MTNSRQSTAPVPAAPDRDEGTVERWTDLDALNALLDGATPGPWEALTDDHGHKGIEHSVWSLARGGRYVAEYLYDDTDATLIAALRNAAPGLIAEVAELRRKVEAVERVVNEPESSVGADGPDDLESVYVTGYNGALILVRAALETA